MNKAIHENGRINMQNIRLYEELSMNALPALRTVLFDGWVLRFANGYTNRANSVSPIYPGSGGEGTRSETTHVCAPEGTGYSQTDFGHGEGTGRPQTDFAYGEGTGRPQTDFAYGEGTGYSQTDWHGEGTGCPQTDFAYGEGTGRPQTDFACGEGTGCPPALTLAEKVRVCELAYSKAGLPAVFKLTAASPAGLDERLAGLGYEILHPTFMYTCDLMCPPSPGGPLSGSVFSRGGIPGDAKEPPGGEKYPPGCAIEPLFPGEKLMLSNSLDPDWLRDCFALEGIAGETAKTASAMLNNIRADVITARILAEGRAAACGMCVIERGYAGLYYIFADAAHRRRGLGLAVCRGLLSAAAKARAKTAYLQVMEDNAPALGLYKKLGFGFCYKYWYRIKR